MRFGAAFWIQRTTWPELRDACLAAERAGWDSLWVDDHLLADEGDPSDPKLEGWATLSALATVTRRVRLGLLVGANTFRNPGLTAKLRDHGRPPVGRTVRPRPRRRLVRARARRVRARLRAGFGERLDRLDEAVGLIRRLLDGERVTHEGRFYAMHDAAVRSAADPGAPADPHRWLRADQDAAHDGPRCRPVERLRRHPSGSPQVSDILRDRCAEVGRPFDEIERTVTIHAVIRDTERAATDAWNEIARHHGIVGRVAADGTEPRPDDRRAHRPDVARYLAGYRESASAR